jgi:hypothetical protein
MAASEQSSTMVLQLAFVLMLVLIFRSVALGEGKKGILSATQEQAIGASWSLRRWLLDTERDRMQDSVSSNSCE